MLINRALLFLARGNKRYIIRVSFVVALTAFLNLIQFYTLSVIVSGLVKDFRLDLPLLLLFLAIALLQILLKPLVLSWTADCEAQVKSNLRERMLERIKTLGLTYTDDARSGALYTLLLDRVEALGPYYSTYIPALLTVMSVSVGTILYIYFINKVTAYIMLAGLLGVVILPLFTYKYLWLTGKEVWQEYDAFGSDFLDLVQGMQTLKNLPACKIEKEKIQAKAKLIHKKTMDNMKVTTIENFLFELFSGTGALLSIAYAAYCGLKGEMGFSELILILFIVRSCFGPVQVLMNAWHLGFNGLSASGKITDFLKTEERQMRSSFDPPAEKSSGLQVEGLSFSYGTEAKVLKGVSVELEDGKITAFVGESGSGKSTLSSLIAGLYPYQEGKIYWGNDVLSKETCEKWQSKLAAVWQEPYLFNLSLKDNLMIAKEDTSEEELEEVIEKSELRDVVDKLPQGIDTLVGEHGTRLSGGERQRLAIARCFLRDADLILFDEATSSLDEKNQKSIQDALERLAKNKTLCIIAHRISTIVNADRIYLLEDGFVRASGDHEELMESSPEYVGLLAHQARLVSFDEDGGER
ncbi:MAG TPA: ATP-binding cassette domain-containing protein [Clostridiaceae bacterium]|nr:ATP-binding cassette domain-containing protein [Clostridiaceae bacterium]